MRQLVRAIVLALPWMIVAAPASASIIEFYEGNNCTQKNLGGLTNTEHVSTGKDKIVILDRFILRIMGVPIANNHPWNDEARSARVSSNWRNEREPRTSYVAVYDSPSADRADDWVRIHVRDATLIPAGGVCITSFERNFSRNGVYLERHPHNGLDGKVSMIASWCKADCRANLTPDPNPPAAAKPRYVPTKRDPARKTLSPEAARILKQGARK